MATAANGNRLSEAFSRFLPKRLLLILLFSRSDLLACLPTVIAATKGSLFNLSSGTFLNAYAVNEIIVTQHAFPFLDPEFSEMVKYLRIIGLCSILALEALFPNVDFADLSRAPESLAHDQDGRIASAEIPFAELFGVHYDVPDHPETRQSDHRGLSFSQRRHHGTSIQITQDPGCIRNQTTHFFLLKIGSVFDDAMHPNSIDTPIWQPPRA